MSIVCKDMDMVSISQVEGKWKVDMLIDMNLNEESMLYMIHYEKDIMAVSIGYIRLDFIHSFSMEMSKYDSGWYH